MLDFVSYLLSHYYRKDKLDELKCIRINNKEHLYRADLELLEKEFFFIKESPNHKNIRTSFSLKAKNLLKVD